MSDRAEQDDCQLSDGGETACTDTEDSEYVGFDNVLHTIGSSMRYQMLQILIILSFTTPYSMASLNYVFIGYEPPHKCAETNETALLDIYSMLNDTTVKIVYEMCQIRITSNTTGHPEDVASTGCISGHSYEGGADMTIKTEWDLVCEKEGVAELIQMMFSLGMTIGALSINPLPDRFGRKPVVIICGVVMTVLELALTFSRSISFAIAVRLFSGIVAQNMGFVPYVLGAELLESKHRHFFAMWTILIWTSNLVLMGCISYALRSYTWRVLQLFTSLTGVLPLMMVYFLNESLPWLFAKGRHTQALELIKQACKTNGANFGKAERVYKDCVERVKRIEGIKDWNSRKPTAAEYGVLDIIRHRKLFLTSLILWLAWFTCNITYLGLFLTAATFNVNYHFMFIILAGVEIPTTVLFFVLLSYVGRRTIVLIFLPIAATSLLVCTCLVGLGSKTSVVVNNASAAFFILGKSAISITFCPIYSFTSEHYPTTLRNIGIGICAFMSRAGAMVAPFLYPLFRIANWAPGTLLTFLCFTTIAFYTMVPETKGRELPTTIGAIEVLSGKEARASTKRRLRNRNGIECRNVII